MHSIGSDFNCQAEICSKTVALYHSRAAIVLRWIKVVRSVFAASWLSYRKWPAEKGYAYAYERNGSSP
jgi:hypothetical protein